MNRSCALLCLSLSLGGCPLANDPVPPSSGDPELDALRSEIRLPGGFQISIFAKVLRPRAMALGDDGTVYVGSYFFTKGATSPVYALRDTDGDGRADFRRDIRGGFGSPNGVAYRDGTLWISDEHRIWRVDDVAATLDAPRPRIVYDRLPSRAQTDSATNVGHFWREMTIGPDGYLYVSVGTRWSFLVGAHTARDLDDDPVYSSIQRIAPDGTSASMYADGVRNAMGLDFHPVTGELWFTDNGPSWPFEHPDTYDIPPDELNRVRAPGEHFGFPFVHGRLADPLIGADAPDGLTEPEYEFAAHSAPLGLEFYTGSSFPERYRNGAFVAEHGTEATTPVFGVRSRVHGDRISFVSIDASGVTSYEVFADGFLRDLNSNYTRRPVDVLTLADGSILVSDDEAQRIYRIEYRGGGS